jgi:hypothetical protein
MKTPQYISTFIMVCNADGPLKLHTPQKESRDYGLLNPKWNKK